MKKVLNPNKAELKLAISYEEQKAIVERYKAAGYEVPDMNILMFSHMRSVMRVVDTYMQSIQLAALEDDGVIDDQEMEIIKRARDAAETFKESLQSIIDDAGFPKEGKPEELD